MVQTGVYGSCIYRDRKLSVSFIAFSCAASRQTEHLTSSTIVVKADAKKGLKQLQKNEINFFYR
jgi:hypothetical protein